MARIPETWLGRQFRGQDTQKDVVKVDKSVARVHKNVVEADNSVARVQKSGGASH